MSSVEEADSVPTVWTEKAGWFERHEEAGGKEDSSGGHSGLHLQ